MMDAITSVLVHPKSPDTLNPYTIPPNPIVERTTDNASIETLRISLTFGKYKTPKIKENSKKGIVNKKIQCHDNVSKISPANVGPSAGPANITKHMIPIAPTRLCGGYIE